MLFFLGRRAVSAVSVVFATLLTTFVLFFIAPTDPAGAICGDRNCSPERYQEIKQNLHLDEPKVEQFGSYIKGIVAGRRSRPPASCRSATRRVSASRSRTTGRCWTC